jgi:hypothetical protein
MIAVRKHLYESATVVLDQRTKKYEAMFVEVRFQVPILGQRSMVIGSARFNNTEAKKAMATEWTRELCRSPLVVNCQILGGDWNRMHSRMAHVLSTLQKQCIFIETPAQQEDVVGIVVWPGPLLTAHVVAKYFSYYNQDLQWNQGDTDSRYMLAAYFRDGQLPANARQRNPATEAERR